MIINTPFTKKDLNGLEPFIEQDISLRCGNKTEAKLLLKDNGLYDLSLLNLIVEDKDKYSFIKHIKRNLVLMQNSAV